MQISILRERAKSILWVITLKMCLELAYIYSIMPIWKNLRFGYEPDWAACAISYFYCIVLVLAIPENEQKLSVLICHFFFITSVIPFMIFYWTNGKEHIYVLGVFLMVLLVFLGANLKSQRWVWAEPCGRGVCHLVFQGLFLLYILGGIYLYIKGGGLHPSALSLVNASQIRRENVQLNILESYWMQWTVKAFTPFFMGYFLFYKKYWMCMLCMVIQAMLYLTYGHKAFLFSIALFWLLYFLAKLFNKVKTKYYMLFSGLAIVALMYGLGNRMKVVWLLTWQGIMRLLFEPAKIKFQYFEYFSVHEKLRFSEGVIGKLLGIEYPYDKAIGYVITEYFSGEGIISNSNTGVIGDLYSQMGYGGIIAGGIVLGLIIRLMDQSSTHIPLANKIAIVSYICITFNDNALQTTLLSGGGMILIILLMIFNTELYSEEHCNRNYNYMMTG